MAVFTVSAQTYTNNLAKLKKQTNVIETRWPQVSVRETLEYLVNRNDLDIPVPADRDAFDRDDGRRREKNHPVF